MRSSPEALAAALKLLDDETPEVRAWVTRRLQAEGADLSETLASLAWHPDEDHVELLRELLAPVRRAALRRDWIVPHAGIRMLEDDWESFEAMLQLLADFLHDGVTLRQPLADALDLVTEEIEACGSDPNAETLRRYLFDEGRFNLDDEILPESYDLCRTLSEGRGSSLALGTLFLLTAARLGHDQVDGVFLPRTFVCRIDDEEGSWWVDFADGGRSRVPASLNALHSPAQPGELLRYWLENLHESFEDSPEDQSLIRELLDALHF